MLKNSITSLLDRIKPTKEERAEIHEFLERPDIREVFNRHEDDILARRREDLAEIKRLSTPPANSNAVERRALDAGKRFEAAEAEYLAAKEELNAARLAATYLGYKEQNKILEIRWQLIKESDPRIADFILFVSNQSSYSKLAEQYWFSKEWTVFGGTRTLHFSNMEEIVEIRAALTEAEEELLGMQMDALSFDQITERLNAISARLKPLLKKIEFEAPELDEHNKVKKWCHPRNLAVGVT